MGLVDNEISFIVKGAEGAEVDKTLGFNREVFVVARFIFANDSFFLFCSYCFLSTSFVD